MFLRASFLVFIFFLISGCSLTSVTVIEHEDTVKEKEMAAGGELERDKEKQAEQEIVVETKGELDGERLKPNQTVTEQENNLKTFTDTKDGYVLRYPAFWRVIQKGSGNYVKSEIQFVPESGENALFSVAVVSKGIEKVDPAYTETGVEKSKILIDDVGAIVYTWESAKRRDYLIDRGGKRFRIMTAPYDETNVVTILESFHFSGT
jgi:hypothetical protein